MSKNKAGIQPLFGRSFINSAKRFKREQKALRYKQRVSEAEDFVPAPKRSRQVMKQGNVQRKIERRKDLATEFELRRVRNLQKQLKNVVNAKWPQPVQRIFGW